MDHYSIVDRGTSQPTVAKVQPSESDGSGTPATEEIPPALQFPGEDRGQSLNKLAQRDLHTTFQLLVERTQYITRASGVAIALCKDGAYVCCASVGRIAPREGILIQASSGLVSECVHSRQISHCDEAGNDPRVDQEDFPALGIASMIVAPLVRNQEVIGIFELFSEKAGAFDEHDISAAQRLSEMVLTAMDQAETDGWVAPAVAAEETATTAAPDTDPQSSTETAPEITTQETVVQDVVQRWSRPETAESPVPTAEEEIQTVALDATIGKCESCGFPVSESRKLCVDCEIRAFDNPSAAPVFLGQYGAEAEKRNWLRDNIYLIGTALVAAATVAALLWLR